MNNHAVGQKTGSLRERHAVTLKRFKQIPGTFHRDRQSYFLVDLLWLLLTFLASLVFAAIQLIVRRRTLTISIQGDGNDEDFDKIKPEAMIQFLSENVQKLQDGLKHGNRHIHFFAAFVDPLPKFISHPSHVVSSLAALVVFYYIYRFWLLHRHWRYNTTILFCTYLTVIPLHLFSEADLNLLSFVVLNGLMPMATLCSVVLHKMLAGNPWKPLTVVLELEPKQDESINEDNTDEATHGLLNGDENTCNEKEDV